MTIIRQYVAICDRCGGTKKTFSSTTLPNTWRNLQGLPLEYILDDYSGCADICLDCVNELDKWIKNGTNNQD